MQQEHESGYAPPIDPWPILIIIGSLALWSLYHDVCTKKHHKLQRIGSEAEELAVLFMLFTSPWKYMMIALPSVSAGLGDGTGGFLPTGEWFAGRVIKRLLQRAPEPEPEPEEEEIDEAAEEIVEDLNLDDLPDILADARASQLSQVPEILKDIVHEVLQRVVYHKKRGECILPVVRSTLSGLKSLDELREALRHIKQAAIDSFASSSSHADLPNFVPHEVETLSYSVGNHAFPSMQAALDYTALEDILSTEFESGGGKAERLADWYARHPDHPDNPLNRGVPVPERPHHPFPDIHVDWTTHQNAQEMFSAGFTAKGGEGIPLEPVPGLVTLDLFATKVACVFQALCFGWMLYTQDIDVNGSNSEKRSVFGNMFSWREVKNFYKDRVVPVLTKRHIPMQWTTDDADILLKHMPGFQLVQIFEGRERDEALMRVLAGDSSFFGVEKRTLYMYITRTNHASLLIHRDLLTPFWTALINQRMGWLYTHVVNKPKLTWQQRNLYKNINAADTESLLTWTSRWRQTNTPLVMCAQVWGVMHTWKGPDCIRQFISWVLSLDPAVVKKHHDQGKAVLEIWFHNLEYDASLMLLDILDACDVDLTNPIEPLSSNNKLISLKAHLRNHVTLYIRDSYRHYRTSLKSWSQSFFPDKPDMWKGDFEVLKCKTPDQVMSRECVEYCQRDVSTLIACLQRVQETSLAEIGINQLATQTITSFSKADYYSNYYDPEKYPIYVPTPAAEEWLRDAYTGGLNMVFRRGITKGKIIDPDINSAYPWAMTHDLPYGKPERASGLKELGDLDAIMQHLKDHPGIYDATVTVQRGRATPWLQLKTENGLEVPYMNRVRSKWTSLRLMEAVDRGAYIHTLHEGILYQLGHLFKDMIEHHYIERAKTKDPVMKAIRKNIMNTGYGAQGFKHKGRSQAVVYGRRISRQMQNNVNVGLAEGERYKEFFVGTEINDIHNEQVSVSIAAWITDRVQSYLLSLKEIIESNPGYKVLYTDTDSLKILCPDSLESRDDLPENIKELLDDKQLGKLKVECMIHEKEYVELAKTLTQEYVPPERCFITEFCALAPKEYYSVDSNGVANAHVKAMNISMLGYDYDKEEHTLSDHDRRVFAAHLMRMSFQDDKPFTVFQRRMFTAKIRTFMQMSTYNEIIELNISGVLKKMHVQDDGWCIPLLHEEWLSPAVYNSAYTRG